jgi:molybdenum cofactor cytidylyltransferase
MSEDSDIAAPILIAILGAGKASRFGGAKLERVCAGKPLGQWALDTARQLALPTVWIAADEAPAFVDCEVVRNARAAEGMGTSVACAAEAAARQEASALLVMLADMPLVSCALLHRLIEAGPLAACAYSSHPGVPALLPARLFGDLQALCGDAGAGRYLRSISDLTLVEAGPNELFDVDTPQALAEVEALLRALP